MVWIPLVMAGLVTPIRKDAKSTLKNQPIPTWLSEGALGSLLQEALSSNTPAYKRQWIYECWMPMIHHRPRWLRRSRPKELAAFDKESQSP